MQDLARFPPLVAVNEVVPVGDDVVDRATRVAERDAAIHAARALLPQRALVERNEELVEMADAVGDRRVALLVPVEFQKTRDLAHGSAALHQESGGIGRLGELHLP